MRKDLKIRKGKQISQGAHASCGVLLEAFNKYKKDGDNFWTFIFQDGSNWDEWLSKTFTKITVSVNSEDELLEIYNKAVDAGMPCSLVTDAGFTEIPAGTKTCAAIGPYWSDDIDKITGDLKLL